MRSKRLTRREMKKVYKAIVFLLLLITSGTGLYLNAHDFPATSGEPGKIAILDANDYEQEVDLQGQSGSSLDLSSIPIYTGAPSCVINKNHPSFTDEEYKEAEKMYIELSEMDNLGRCGKAEGSLSEDTLSSDDRGDISSVHPSGWNQAFYPELISKNNGALYNRCHLLMYAMSGLTSDKRNLITGTEYMNTKGMLPYETAVHNWIERNPGERVLYRVTPIYEGSDLVARGVHMEGASVSDKGSRFHINAFCYNVEPGVLIDYATGKSVKE